MFWIIVPFSRPQQSQHIQKCWKSQSIKSNLIVCANGCEYHGKATHVVNLPYKDHVDALNAGLTYILAHANAEDWICRMDDDDEYSDNYLEIVLKLPENVEWSGYSSVLTKTDRGLWRIENDPNSPSALGGTIAAKAKSFAYFDQPPQNMRYIDDVLWSKKMAHLPFKHRGPEGFIWNRIGTDHIYPVGAQELTWMKEGRLYDAKTGKPIEPEDPFDSQMVKDMLKGVEHGKKDENIRI